MIGVSSVKEATSLLFKDKKNKEKEKIDTKLIQSPYVSKVENFFVIESGIHGQF